MKRLLLLAFAALFVACVACAQGSIPRPGTSTTGTTKASNPAKAAKAAKATKGKLNGHEWVDLGLPSGTKWASRSTAAMSRPQTARTIVYEEFGQGWDIPTSEQLAELFKYTTQELYISGSGESEEYVFEEDEYADAYIKFKGKNGNVIRIIIDDSTGLSDDGELHYFNLGHLDGQRDYWQKMVYVNYPGKGLAFPMPFFPGETDLNAVHERAVSKMSDFLFDEFAYVYSFYDDSTGNYETNEGAANKRFDNVEKELRKIRVEVDGSPINTREDRERIVNILRAMNNMEFRVRPVINK